MSIENFIKSKCPHHPDKVVVSSYESADGFRFMDGETMHSSMGEYLDLISDEKSKQIIASVDVKGDQDNENPIRVVSGVTPNIKTEYDEETVFSGAGEDLVVGQDCDNSNHDISVVTHNVKTEDVVGMKDDEETVSLTAYEHGAGIQEGNDEVPDKNGVSEGTHYGENSIVNGVLSEAPVANNDGPDMHPDHGTAALVLNQHQSATYNNRNQRSSCVKKMRTFAQVFKDGEKRKKEHQIKKIEANHKAVKALRSYQENMNTCTLTYDAIDALESYVTQLMPRYVSVKNDEIPLSNLTSKPTMKPRLYKSKTANMQRATRKSISGAVKQSTNDKIEMEGSTALTKHEIKASRSITPRWKPIKAKGIMALKPELRTHEGIKVTVIISHNNKSNPRSQDGANKIEASKPSKPSAAVKPLSKPDCDRLPKDCLDFLTRVKKMLRS
eukprot:scaffold86406_cov44-Cyclotella_meneghiniana.AAC.2